MSIFKFKKFQVDQEGCAMKINTDGVLLAALVESNEPRSILDIGTGTGVLALMMAQRFKYAKIEAIEIDEQASATARKNFQLSVFHARLLVNNIAIEKYNTLEKFDLIISNPPFFINYLKNLEEKKGIARHTNIQFFYDLIEKVDLLLSQEGSFWFILPIKQAELLIKKGIAKGLYPTKITTLHSDASKPAFRWIVCLDRRKIEAETAYFHIYESERKYTQAYKDLLKDYFFGY